MANYSAADGEGGHYTIDAQRKRHIVMTGEYFEQVLDAYFQGWRDGYAQAINDVEHVLDDQTNRESNK